MNGAVVFNFSLMFNIYGCILVFQKSERVSFLGKGRGCNASWNATRVIWALKSFSSAFCNHIAQSNLYNQLKNIIKGWFDYCCHANQWNSAFMFKTCTWWWMKLTLRTQTQSQMSKGVEGTWVRAFMLYHFPGKRVLMACCSLSH